MYVCMYVCKTLYYMNTRTALTDTTDTNTLSLHAASGTRQLLRVRVDTDTRFSHTIKSRNLYTVYYGSKERMFRTMETKENFEF